MRGHFHVVHVLKCTLFLFKKPFPWAGELCTPPSTMTPPAPLPQQQHLHRHQLQYQDHPAQTNQLSEVRNNKHATCQVAFCSKYISHMCILNTTLAVVNHLHLYLSSLLFRSEKMTFPTWAVGCRHLYLRKIQEQGQRLQEFVHAQRDRHMDALWWCARGKGERVCASRDFQQAISGSARQLCAGNAQKGVWSTPNARTGLLYIVCCVALGHDYILRVSLWLAKTS